MATQSNVDVRSLESVRNAASALHESAQNATPKDGSHDADDVSSQHSLQGTKQAWLSAPQSPLTRRIITFNLIAIILLISGVLYLNPSRDNLAYQRATGLVTETGLIASIVEEKIKALSNGAPQWQLQDANPQVLTTVINDIGALSGVKIGLYTSQGTQLTLVNGTADNSQIPGLERSTVSTTLISFFDTIWDTITVAIQPDILEETTKDIPSQDYIQAALNSGTNLFLDKTSSSATLNATAPIMYQNAPIGVVMVSSQTGELDALLNRESEQVIRLFLVGLFISVGLSLVLASTIANPISDLARAAEAAHRKDARRMPASKIIIPDLTSRPDEIGRLSAAMRGMVKALYQRIESNEQFATDVAHEIKNPLASLGSAVGSLRLTKKDEQRERLLDVIEHDVSRLDRLVTDIANASRIDSELVRDEEAAFDLVHSLRKINQILQHDAVSKGIEYIEDLPKQPMIITGMENRLAQVFVNLITNAISFCQDGDAIRIWLRAREDRVLIVIEDTGPGIPEGMEQKIFQRFYSERPEGQFGNNSGLGLSISKQIVEAHGGVIWAENIVPTQSDTGSEPLGARFVVGLAK